MNLTSLLNFESVTYRGAQTQTNQFNDMIASSMRQIIENFYMQLAHSFIIMASCRRRSTMNLFRYILENLHHNIDNMVIQLVHVKFEQPQRIEGLRMHNILFVDSLDAFLDIDIASYVATYDSYEYYYILLQQRDHLISNDMKGIFEYCWHNQLTNCNVQIQNESGELLIYTYFPYTAEHCNKVVPVLINQFSDTHWLSQKYFPSKFDNFYQCSIYAAVRNIPPYLVVQKLPDQTYKIEGLEGYLLKQLSDNLNFSLEIMLPTEKQTHAQRAGNLSVGTYGLLASRSAHLAIGYFRKRTTIQSILTSSTFPHYQSSIVVSIFLNAHNLTTYQILIFPFESESWLAIFFSFVGSICAVALLQHLTDLRGKSLRSNFASIYPVLSAALGMPLPITPNATGERLLYISWIFATFLIRTMYSALLFHFFRNFVHQKIPRTFTELSNDDYTMAINNFTLQDLLGIPYLEQYSNVRSIIFNSSFEDVAFPYLETHVEENIYAITSREFLIYYVSSHQKPGRFRMLTDIVAQQQLTLRLPKHSFLTNIFDESIMAIQAVGLMDIWTRWTLNDKYFKSMHLYSEKLIEQKDLNGLYVVICVLYVIALVIFCLELLSTRSKLLRKIFLKV